jgi:hydrogenase maturation protein HypF
MPYDRPATSMAAFTLCPACEKEYNDPDDRRFHAQPNACWNCGPRCRLQDNQGKHLPGPNPIRQAADLLRDGHILAIKGLGGFHLAVDACREESVRKLRQRKRRDEKPFAIMARDLDQIRTFAEVSADEEILLRSPQRPIVLLRQKEGTPIAPSVAPRNRYFGVMLPCTPLHILLFETFGCDPLVMTSGNFSEEPIVTANRQAMDFLRPIADYFLVHNRDILVRNDDSVCRTFNRRIYFLRRSRGYAPAPVPLPWSLPPVLATGAELKNTVTLTRDDRAYVSQHIGDLENTEVFHSFEETIRHLKELYSIEPEAIAYDLHPEYLSTKYALSREDEIRLVGVQHHHAHIVSCMAENAVSEPVIGLSLDGTGYGTDGRIWGGEFLRCDLADFERLAHFEYVPMPGGSRAIREPWRMAVSYLRLAYGEDFRRLHLPLLAELDTKSLELLLQMMNRRLNCPETSSLGRLFDGVAALCNLRQRVFYEGQAAMELEMALDHAAGDPGYEFTVEDGTIRVAPLIRNVVDDVMAGVSTGRISYRFHAALVELMRNFCRHQRTAGGPDTVALSGGVFQNHWLLNALHKELSADGFRVLVHHLVPANDGGISLGQAVVAGVRLNSLPAAERKVTRKPERPEPDDVQA